MGISHYIKEIGRGARGASRSTRAQACDLFGQVLDGTVTDLEMGAFCLAMRIKGETPEEMAGFLDATHARLARFPAERQARWWCCPATTARASCRCSRPCWPAAGARGLPVLMHGTATEATPRRRADVLEAWASRR